MTHYVLSGEIIILVISSHRGIISHKQKLRRKKWVYITGRLELQTPRTNPPTATTA
jgi:hypothetical protein